MSDTLTYTCTGTDPAEALRVLREVVEEMHRRDHAVVMSSDDADARQPWSGPDLHLTVEAVDQLDGGGLIALGHLAEWGPMFGVTGVVRGRLTPALPAAVRVALRDGVPFRFEQVVSAPA